MGDETDGANVRFPPPLLYLAAIGVGVGLQFLWPLPLLPGDPIRLGGGILMIVLGLGLTVRSIRMLIKTGQDPEPWKPTPSIVMDGPFGISRNPVYVGVAIVQAGIGFAVGNPWIVALVIPVIVVLHVFVVLREEAYLQEKFGQEYREYMGKVRRWL